MSYLDLHKKKSIAKYLTSFKEDPYPMAQVASRQLLHGTLLELEAGGTRRPGQIDIFIAVLTSSYILFAGLDVWIAWME